MCFTGLLLTTRALRILTMDFAWTLAQAHSLRSSMKL